MKIKRFNENNDADDAIPSRDLYRETLLDIKTGINRFLDKYKDYSYYYEVGIYKGSQI